MWSWPRDIYRLAEYVAHLEAQETRMAAAGRLVAKRVGMSRSKGSLVVGSQLGLKMRDGELKGECKVRGPDCAY